MATEFHPEFMDLPCSGQSFSIDYQEGHHQQPRLKRLNQNFHPDDVRYMMGDAVGERYSQYYGNGHGTRSHTVSESSSVGSPGNNNNSTRGHATKLCETYLAGKNCRFGNRCWYAHGTWELKHFDQSNNNSQDYAYPDEPRSCPTTAQIEWVRRSQQAALGPDRELLHESIIQGNRFGAGKIYTQQRSAAPPATTQMLFNRWPVNTHQCPTPQHNMPVQKPRQSKSLIELMMDIDAPIHENDPESPMPYTMPDMYENFPQVAAQLPRGFLGFIKDDGDQKKSSERCDIYAVSGFCPLGDDCNFQHK